MKIEIKIPAMGESISEATIGTLLKASGSKVAMDEEVLELETDKVNQVLHAPQAGIFTATVKTGDIVKIGQVVGFVDTEGAPVEAPKPEKIVPPPPPPVVPKAIAGTARYSKESFVADLKKPPKTAATPKPAPVTNGRETRRPMSKIRKVIASRLLDAQQTTAMLTTFNEVDMSAVIEMRNKYKDLFQKEHGVKLGFMSFFVKAVVSALQAVPGINSYIDGEDLVHRDYYDIGVAVGTDRGVFVPVVRNCDQFSYADIERSIEGYAKKAREGKLVVDDLQGGGFTITNGGVYGSLLSTPILNPPQSGILGMHNIQKRAIVIKDEIVIRPMMYLALSYDHRVVDGKEAVTFLVHVKEYLEDPSRFLLGV